MMKHKRLLQTILVFAFSWLPAMNLGAQDQHVICVVGAAGTEEYGKQFQGWATQIREVCTDPNLPNSIPITMIGLEKAESTDLELLKTAIESTATNVSELWVILLGHGTDDRKFTKFNLKGPDVSAMQMKGWLAGLKCKTILVNCSSSSGPFIQKLKGKNRVIVTATKSGAQMNFARFGSHLVSAIADPSLDLDKDNQTSLLEAFIGASARTQEFYEQETRLSTELAMIDDNGDGLGTPADWFEGTRVIKKPKSGKADGIAANQVFLIRRGEEAKLTPEQRSTRDELERKLELWRAKKSRMNEEDYFKTIEPILLELAKLYREVGK